MRQLTINREKVEIHRDPETDLSSLLAEVRKNAPITALDIADKSEEPKKAAVPLSAEPPRPIQKKKKKRKKKPLKRVIKIKKKHPFTIPLSLSNLFIFSLIFFAIFAANAAVKLQANEFLSLKVTPVVLSSSEELLLNSEMNIEEPATGEVVPEQKVFVPPVEAPTPVEIETAVVEPKIDETPKIEEAPKAALKKRTSKKKTRPLPEYAREDAFTNGGPLDLDSHTARQKYREGNITDKNSIARRSPY